jgi:hypothetical protein
VTCRFQLSSSLRELIVKKDLPDKIHTIARVVTAIPITCHTQLVTHTMQAPRIGMRQVNADNIAANMLDNIDISTHH